MVFKRWVLLIAFVVFTTSLARAEVLVTTVFNVVESLRTESLLVLSGADGRVFKVNKTEESIALYKSLVGQVVKIDYFPSGKDYLISKIEVAADADVDPAVMDLNHFRYNQLRQFTPTDLQTIENANQVFKNMLNDGDRRRTQCFKRAHMWAFDMWSKLNISSQKIFIFYTQRYIQLEEFEWWFHVAPMVVVGGEEYVMDGTFMTKPITLKAWKDHFIKTDKVNCPVVENYNDYRNNQWTKLCYLMKTPMYYFSPINIENRDNKGKVRNHWVLEELQDARRAFKGYGELYEGLDSGKPTHTY